MILQHGMQGTKHMKLQSEAISRVTKTKLKRKRKVSEDILVVFMTYVTGSVI